MEKEDKLLLALIDDRIHQARQNDTITGSGFLDLRQKSLVSDHVRGESGVTCHFYGGYEDAERCIAVFLPEYETAGESICTYFDARKEEDPLALLRVQRSPGGRTLSHRDYLGSLLALGIKREGVGDILARETGADILILREIGPFLLSHYTHAGREELIATLADRGQLILPEGRQEEKRAVVASLRLDNLVSAAFSLSRKEASEGVRKGLVFVNHRQVMKPDFQGKEGDKIVFRGHGKIILKAVDGKTKKDRIAIRFDRFL